MTRDYTKDEITAALDYAVLKPTATCADIYNAAELVEANGIASICVAPCNVSLARQKTKRVCSVIGFPHGNTFTKFEEAVRAIDNGARELDVVLNYGRFLEGSWFRAYNEICSIVPYAHKRNVLVKVILETCYYTPNQIMDAVKLCIDCEADYVKTSTGFARDGATYSVVELMVETAQDRIKVKASGGIHDYANVKMYLDLNCARIGSSKFHELLP
jgi:deoxyribose-phosphate aldolase